MSTQNYLLFLDLDGVLVDFDAGVREITGRFPVELAVSEMWGKLARTPDFYDILDWMSDGRQLWEYCKSYNPTILTGLPRGKWAEPQKRSWCSRELGNDIPVITCMSREKAHKAAELRGDAIPVLVDDRTTYRHVWEEMGGVYIHHRSAAQSIRELQALGFT